MLPLSGTAASALFNISWRVYLPDFGAVSMPAANPAAVARASFTNLLIFILLVYL